MVKNKLVACVNIFPIESVYSWSTSAKASVGKQNKIIKEKEFAAIFKTKKENFRKVEKFILQNHSYDIPCIIEIPVGRVTKKYLSWLG